MVSVPVSDWGNILRILPDGMIECAGLLSRMFVSAD